MQTELEPVIRRERILRVKKFLKGLSASIREQKNMRGNESNDDWQLYLMREDFGFKKEGKSLDLGNYSPITELVKRRIEQSFGDKIVKEQLTTIHDDLQKTIYDHLNSRFEEMVERIQKDYAKRAKEAVAKKMADFEIDLNAVRSLAQMFREDNSLATKAKKIDKIEI